MKYTTVVPVFNGFYSTVYGGLFDVIDDNCEIIDNVEIDYNKASFEIAKIIIDYFNSHEISKRFGIKWIFEKIYSPKEYNYSNDQINCEISVNLRKLKAWYKEVKKSKEFEVFLKDNFTSYSGFCSYYDNYVDSPDWQEITDENIHFILDFMFPKDKYEVDLYYYICDYFNIENYIIDAEKTA